MKGNGGFFGAILLSFLLIGACGMVAPHFAMAQLKCNIFQATSEEPNQMTPEVSTEELAKLLAGGAKPFALIDSRPKIQFDVAHIPGAINIPEIDEDRITQIYPDKTILIVNYCNSLY